MADVEATAPESSTEATPAPAESKPAQEPFAIPTDPKAYAEWRQTGKLPGDGTPSKREASASSKSSVDEESENSAPVSETGNKGRDNAESRIKKVVSERDAFRSERDTYKAKLEALEAGKKDASVNSSPAPAKHEKADSSSAPELTRPQRPKQEDYNDWESYEKAQDKYLEDLADFKAAARLEEHTQRQRHEATTREMQARLDEAKERYGPDAEEAIVGSAKSIFADDKVAPALKAAITRSGVIVDALYVLGSDAEEMSTFLQLAKSDPLEALRKWFTVEALVKEELKSGTPAKGASNGSPARGADGKFLPPENGKPARKEAPSPPRELGGNSSPPGDERDRAVKANDFRSFKAAQDRLDIQRFRGQ